MQLTKGRFPSLMAWGLLVGGIALLITFPEINTGDALFIGAIPAALLFVLAGLTFGMSHPQGTAWMGALLLGWLPAVVGTVSYLRGGDRQDLNVALLFIIAPAILSALGAAAGAMIARWRSREA